MKMLEEKHRFATRWFHWVNFPLLSGDDFQRAADLLGLRSLPHRPRRHHPLPFFPRLVLQTHRRRPELALGMALHFAFAWLFALNGIAYVLYTLFSGEWRELFPDRKSFREALQVAMHDMGFKVPLPPQGRYNAAQRITYYRDRHDGRLQPDYGPRHLQARPVALADGARWAATNGRAGSTSG